MPRLQPAILLGILLAPAAAFGIAGTDKIATEGRPVAPGVNWPEGLAALVNDPARTDGWHDWFSEWPNDVVHYRFRAANTEEVNALLKKLAQVKANTLQVHLSPLPEPSGFGWVSSFPKHNGTPVVLSFGDQKTLDEWFQRLPNGKFGVMEFEKTPVAVPPTLTIYTRNKAIDLDRLDIPPALDVTAGDLPRLFHESNLKQPPRKDQKPPAETDNDPAARAVKAETARIDAWLAARKQRIEREKAARPDAR
jgi:hypothetical protein